MKLVVCGKGGSGKSTIAALLAKQYARTGRRVLVVDTDESNASLHRLLGIGVPKDLLGFFGGKKGMMEAFREARENDVPKPLDCAWAIDNIPEEFISKKDGIQLVAIGKIHQAGEGCACPMGVLAKQFLSGLILSENDIVIIDTEAGIEHFGRGIDKVCNSILMVIDPSYESIHLAERVASMAEQIDVPHYYILNKTDTMTARALRDRIHDNKRIIGEINQDQSILVAGLSGQELSSLYPEIESVAEVLGTKSGSS
ncbi:MAG: Light-independent protochlorophyllide reductase iron-sulfur ATP-binding protein [Methanoregulaceae archaeon PtaB.Bin056]|jgi:CO dehydrogenase maturation factor|nr:MAG: Light-independent protochlorophyllide reductase iron-sulfur ATP-binding protein [Methanoregulaceae archaeon PtaB.Bin056]